LLTAGRVGLLKFASLTVGCHHGKRNPILNGFAEQLRLRL